MLRVVSDLLGHPNSKQDGCLLRLQEMSKVQLCVQLISVRPKRGSNGGKAQQKHCGTVKLADFEQKEYR